MNFTLREGWVVHNVFKWMARFENSQNNSTTGHSVQVHANIYPWTGSVIMKYLPDVHLIITKPFLPAKLTNSSLVSKSVSNNLFYTPVGFIHNGEGGLIYFIFYFLQCRIPSLLPMIYSTYVYNSLIRLIFLSWPLDTLLQVSEYTA